jgi:hypothetical protein
LALNNLYSIIYCLHTRKKFRDERQKIATQKISYSSLKYDNMIAIMKALIDLEVRFDKNTTFVNIKEQLTMDQSIILKEILKVLFLIFIFRNMK